MKIISKKLSEGHPHIIGIMNDGTIDGIVNTITGEHAPLRDGFLIRRTAAEKRLPCFASLDTARVAVDPLLSGEQLYNAQPLPEYRAKEPE